jgi:hypothetical protein
MYENKPMKKRQTEFNGNFKMVQWHIYLYCYHSQRNLNKDVRNIVGPAQKVIEKVHF